MSLDKKIAVHVIEMIGSNSAAMGLEFKMQISCEDSKKDYDVPVRLIIVLDKDLADEVEEFISERRLKIDLGNRN